MDRSKLLQEIFIIQDNCLFSAEAHHHIAASCKQKSILFKIAPAVLAAIMGILAASGVWTDILVILAAIGASIAAVANILNPDRDYQAHLSAARSFTILKHDARFLRESLNDCLGDDQFCESTKNLHLRYNDLVHMMPPTNDKAFEQARTRIRNGVHEPTKVSTETEQER